MGLSILVYMIRSTGNYYFRSLFFCWGSMGYFFGCDLISDGIFSGFWWLVCSLLFIVSFVYLYFFPYFFVGVAWGSFLVVICFLMVLFFLGCEFVSLRFPKISAR